MCLRDLQVQIALHLLVRAGRFAQCSLRQQQRAEEDRAAAERDAQQRQRPNLDQQRGQADFRLHLSGALAVHHDGRGDAQRRAGDRAADVGHVAALGIVNGLVPVEAGEGDHVGDAVLVEAPAVALHVDVLGEALGRELGVIAEIETWPW